MVENSVPLVARISLTNTSDTVLSNLTVELALLPDFSAKWTAHVSAIPPGGTFHLDTIELPLDRDRLVNQLERSRAELMLWVRDGAADLPIAIRSVPVDVLAYNEWSPRTVPGVRLHQIAGIYDKGESRTNRAEAQAVVADLVARLRSPDADQQTFGVVTFSQAQQQLAKTSSIARSGTTRRSSGPSTRRMRSRLRSAITLGR
jgi:hypothetical protein